MKQRKRSPCELALDHFDLHYKPVYDWQWPSIRVSLLSKPKHCALINSFVSDPNEVAVSLAELGAHDFIWTAREKSVNRELTDDSSNSRRSTTEGVGEMH